jgi:hypothetical protein
MNLTKRSFVSCTILLLLFVIRSDAQENTQWHHYNLNFGGGVTPPAGADSKRLDTGWNFVAGGGYNFTRNIGIVGEYMVNQMDVSSSVLRQLNVPGGTGTIWSITANPTIRFNPNGRVGAYLIGGGGLYTRTIEFTRPTTAAVDFFDPWFGLFGTAFIPADQVIGTFTRRAGGWNAGGGQLVVANRVGDEFEQFCRIVGAVLSVEFGLRVEVTHLYRFFTSLTTLVNEVLASPKRSDVLSL